MKNLANKKVIIYILLPLFYLWAEEYVKLATNPWSDFMTLWCTGSVIWASVKTIKIIKTTIKNKTNVQARIQTG
tara:strand:+ start:268 stop:489 length:222 start_codon:yes stop_codon:yes gene_type:complete